MATSNGVHHQLAESIGDQVADVKSTWDLLAEGVRNNPNGIALSAPYQPANDLAFARDAAVPVEHCKNHLAWTYQELEQRAECFAALLSDQGVRKGHVITCLLWNSAEWALTFWAAAKLEASLAMMDPRVVVRPTEFMHCTEILQSSVFVVENSSTAMKVHELQSTNGMASKCLKLVWNAENSSMPDGWLTVDQLYTKDCSNPLPDLESQNPLLSNPNLNDDVAVILFTSGSTSLPKCCPLTVENLSAGTACFQSYRGLCESSKPLVHGPCFHIQSFNVTVCAWRAGAEVVFPNKTFDAALTLKTIESEQCTHMSCTPSMIGLLQASPSFKKGIGRSLQSLVLGAEKVSPEIIRKCQEIFGVERIQPGYGMTEGHCAIWWKYEDRLSFHEGFAGVGRVLPGARVKICDRETRQTLRHGEYGEIHIGGQTMMKRYLGDSNSDEIFYEDDKGQWFITGDQGMMDESGVIYITGRFKDIIIRGGENISPGTIEDCLEADPDVLQAQVIGNIDAVAGEVPVALVKTSLGDASTLKSTLQHRVLSKLGPLFALDQVLTLDDLGIEAFPVTTSGKIKKTELAGLIEEKNRVDDNPGADQSKTTQSSNVSNLQKVWGRLLGMDPAELDPSRSVLGFADSLTILRVCNDIQSTLGKHVSSQDVLENDTIEKQAELLDKLPSLGGKKDEQQGKTTDSVKSETDTVESPNLLDTASKIAGVELGDPDLAASVALELKKLDLEWSDDVEDIMPMRDASRTTFPPPRPQSFNWRWCYEVPGKSVSEVYEGLSAALTHHPIMRAIWAPLPGGLDVHTIVKPSAKWFRLCVREATESVTTPDDLFLILPGYDDKDFAIPPHPLVRAVITHVESTGNVGLVLYIHHSLFDAISIMHFWEDLDTAFTHGSRAQLSSVVPYRNWVNLWWQNRAGHATKGDVAYHVERLRGLSKLQDGFWPPHRASGRFIGECTGWQGEECGACGAHLTRTPRDPPDECRGGLGIERRQEFSNFQKLQTIYGIGPSTVVKGALALMNMKLTGASYAVFANTDAGRMWPYLDKWISDLLPSPMSVAGPTLTGSLNIIRPEHSDTWLDFLCHLQEEQKVLSERAHAPVSEIAASLGDDGRSYLPAARSQLYNWDPSIRIREGGLAYKSLKLIHRQLFLESMVFYNCGLRNERELVVLAMYDDCQLSAKEMEHALDLLMSYVATLTDSARWGENVEW